jgi:hypothetical protein
VFVNEIPAAPWHADVWLAINAAVGGLATVIVETDVLVPPGPVAVKVTVYVPEEIYILLGETWVDVLPLPKFQEYEVAFEEVLIN